MKTKTFNHFRNIFAFIGFFIIACSAAVDDSPIPIEPPVVQNNIGKYQVSITTGSGKLYMISVNTETGASKTYKKDVSVGVNEDWIEYTTSAITFTH